MATAKLICYVALISAFTSIPPAYSWQPISDDNRQYIEQLYEAFICPWQRLDSRQSRDFGVLTLETNTHHPVHHLNPIPLQFGGEKLSSSVNYYAAVPDFTFDPPRRVEDQMKEVLDEWMNSPDFSSYVTDVYILTYYSPCSQCASVYVDLADTYPDINFHIGFMELHGEPFSLIRNLEIFQQYQNIFFDDVSPFCKPSRTRRNAGRVTDCPVVCKLPAFWGEWTPYRNCSKPCGGGQQLRQRTCYLDGPAPGLCSGPASQPRSCNTLACRDKRSHGEPHITVSENATYNNCNVDGTGSTCNGGATRRESGCFAGDSMVRVMRIPDTIKEDKIERKRMDQLKVGDFVESYDPETKSVVYSEVYFIVHEDETSNASLIKLTVGFDKGKELSLRLHSKHLVYACQIGEKSTGLEAEFCPSPPLNPVTAESIQVGDIIWMRNSGGEFSPRPVVDIGEYWSGIRHPMTFSHYIVADDILASVHMYDEALYRQVTAPLRFLYGINPSITNTKVVKKMVQMWDHVEQNLL